MYCNEAFRKTFKPPTPPPQKSLIELLTPELDCVCGNAYSVVREEEDGLVEKEEKETIVAEDDSRGESIFSQTNLLCGATMQSSPSQQQQQLPQAFANAGRAFSNFATSSLQNLTTRRYNLPDKSVASQVLMYRQLLHTNCRPGLKLSRDYQGTPAQVAVKHMPWWEEGIDETKKMVISYDNLIVRLWLNGAIMPHSQLADQDKASIDTMIDEKGLPPAEHEYWVSRLGFQQPSPVTDFRSGGMLSLAMMVHIVEACPAVHERFVAPKGDASVLPFGITCINVTDLLSKLCMLAKSVDRMDALLSQKPFWRMFADPNSILVLQELSLDMLADVVVELREERQIPGYRAHDDTQDHSRHNPEGEPGKITVFDFSLIMERTEKRVEKDLLGAGPKSVEELRAIRVRLKQRYRAQLQRVKQRTEQQLQKQQEKEAAAAASAAAEPMAETAETDVASSSQETGDATQNMASSRVMGGLGAIKVDIKMDQVKATASNVATGATTMAAGVATGATSMAAGVFSKIKSPGFNPLRKVEAEQPQGTDMMAPQAEPDLMTFSPAASAEEDGDWVQSPMKPPTDAIENFTIDDDDDML